MSQWMEPMPRAPRANLTPNDVVQVLAALLLATLMFASLLSMGSTAGRSLGGALEIPRPAVAALLGNLEGAALRLGELATSGPAETAGSPIPIGSLLLTPVSDSASGSGDLNLGELIGADAGGEAAVERTPVEGATEPGLRLGHRKETGPPTWALGASGAKIAKVMAGPRAPAASGQKGAGRGDHAKARGRRR